MTPCPYCQDQNKNDDDDDAKQVNYTHVWWIGFIHNSIISTNSRQLVVMSSKQFNLPRTQKQKNNE